MRDVDTMEEQLDEIIEDNSGLNFKQRYFLHLAYDGTGYCGWQVQPNGDTIQAQVNIALSQILNQHINVMGCGRTDAGVHATSFYAHFDYGGELPSRFVDRLNSVLPSAIVIFDLIPVHHNAHTRFNAFERTYEYYIHFTKSPFLKLYSFYLSHPNTDWDTVYKATELLTTFKDFSSLCRPSEDFKTNICDVSFAKWDWVTRPSVAGPRHDEFIRFTITSNRFLRGMVRKTVGTLLMVGRGKVSLDEFQETVATQKDFYKTALAPAQGLYLTNIKYPYPLNGIVAQEKIE